MQPELAPLPQTDQTRALDKAAEKLGVPVPPNDEGKVERVAQAIMKEAGLINDPSIQADVTERRLITMMYARRYARAAIAAYETP